jgi:hypothetical protein
MLRHTIKKYIGVIKKPILIQLPPIIQEKEKKKPKYYQK